MNIDLSDMIILVTGAANGVGHAVAREASKANAAGLVLTDVDGKRLQQVEAELSPKTQVHAVAADLEESDAAETICKSGIETFGRIDGLVNAAGITDRADLLSGGVNEWDRTFAINTRTPFFLMQHIVKDILKRGSAGSIVNIQSVNAHTGSPELAIYSASKGALQTLTRNTANAFMRENIRVNGINLGWTLTEGEHRMQANTLNQGDDWLERVIVDRPWSRLLTPDEPARLAVYLLSNESAPLTGASIDLEQSVIGTPQ